MAEPEHPEPPTLGAVLDGIVGSMTPEQFAGLAERTGHATAEPKQAAADAIAELVRKGNIAAHQSTTAEVAARMTRRGWRTA